VISTWMSAHLSPVRTVPSALILRPTLRLGLHGIDVRVTPCFGLENGAKLTGMSHAHILCR